MDPLPFIRPRHLDAPGPQQGGAALPPRRKTSAACTSCRAKKSRCDGQKPFCSECIRFRRRCVYQDSDKRKKDTWQSAINELREKNERLEAIVKSLKCDSFDEAIDQLRRLRENQHQETASYRVDDTRSRTASYTPSSAQSSTGSSASKSVVDKEMPESTPRTDSSTTLVDADDLDLPPEDITRHAVSAFFTCGSTLFYIMSQDDSKSIIQAVYERRPNITKSTVCQLCALAAVGSYYCTDEIPAAASERYFQQASSLLQDIAMEDDLGTMRVFACLSVYLILLKGTSARAMTTSGLNIARHNIKKYTPKANHLAWEEWAKVLRTIAFTECWLSSTLDYKFDLGQEEVEVVNDLATAESANNPENELNSSFIQSQIFKLSLLSAQLFEYIRSTADLAMTDLQRLSEKLSTWLWELPPCMCLASLTSGDSPTPSSAWRPLLFLHMLHINLQITIYERVMHVILRRSTNPSDDVIVREVLQIPPATQRVYESFAQQLARIVRLLYAEHRVIARCWMTINACYHSSLILLLSAAQHLALRADPYQPLVMEDLSHVQLCLQVLRFCENYDIAAMRLVDVIVPLYQRLCDTVGQPDTVNSLTQTYPMTDIQENGGISAKIGRIIFQSVAAMRLPCQEIWV